MTKNVMQENIPKVIHYCWFGGGELPPLAQKCIASWKKYLPDYEIKEWNESNFDVNIVPYTAQAYARKKYAFVSDYARLWILYKYGGLYFDTDVEVIKSMDDILERGAFMGCERDGGDEVNPGLGVACAPGLGVACALLDIYGQENFIKFDGKIDDTTIVERTTELLVKYGLQNKKGIQRVADLTIYPAEYFCPKNFETGKMQITKNTRSIHWYDASWQPWYKKMYIVAMRLLPKKLQNAVRKKVKQVKSAHSDGGTI